jgi:putative two-component system response regulator
MTKRLSVLLVDDDPIQLRWLGRLSEMCGFEVQYAEDGSEGLDAVRRHPPDLIVTDVHMPRMTGPRMLQLLRKIPVAADIPVIVVTADASRETKIKLLQSGADDFIVKPVDAQEFMARLRVQARRCDLNAELLVTRNERDQALDDLQERASELERLTFGLIAALEKANTLNDNDTKEHIRRICEFSVILAQAAEQSMDFIKQIGRYAGLHDVGKVGIRDAILKKTVALTPLEEEELKTHTLIGADILRSAGLPQPAINIALSHHERWDGQGYPHRLSGQQIPLEARIVAVADAYDTLRSRSSQRPSLPVEEALAVLEASAGSHLDPTLVRLFFSVYDEISRIEASHFKEDTTPSAVWA